MLLKLPPEEIVPTISKIEKGEMAFQEQDKFRDLLFNEWDDITELILHKSEQNLN